MVKQEEAGSKSEDEAKIKEAEGEASDTLSKALKSLP